MNYITVEQLNKSFTVRKKIKGTLLREKNTVQALRDVNFTIQQGELVGYIGPNGAGKSTTVKILSGILTPDSGRVEVGGLCPWEKRKKHVSRIGVVFGQRMQLWWDVPIKDSYHLLKDIYKVSDGDYTARMKQLSEALHLEPIKDIPLRMLSLGQRMRAELAGSLLHRPQLLFLDEPTIGLDAVSKLTIRNFLKQENWENGTTILLTTHDMEDIAALCPRVMVLGNGSLLYDGALDHLLEKYDTEHVLTARYEEINQPIELPDFCEVERSESTLVIRYEPALLPTPALLQQLQHFGKIAEFTAQPQSIDEMIAKMYREMSL